MFYLTTHSAHFIYGYMTSDHSDSERENPLPPHGLIFPISSKGSFIYSQDNIYHGLCGALAGTKRIDPTTHHTMNERSYGRVILMRMRET